MRNSGYKADAMKLHAGIANETGWYGLLGGRVLRRRFPNSSKGEKGALAWAVSVKYRFLRMEAFLGLKPGRFETLSGYVPTDEDFAEHLVHDPNADRYDDCPLCWADVTSDEQRDWLVQMAQDGVSNAISLTMGLRLRPEIITMVPTKGDDDG